MNLMIGKKGNMGPPKSQSERSSYQWGQKNPKLGHIAEFVETYKDYFRNQQAARAGIMHGIKLLACEMLLGETGFSAILAFHYSVVRAIRYEDLIA